MTDFIKRFTDKFTVDGSTGCWMWTAHKQSIGYGTFSVRHRHVLAHRYAYEMAHGQIPNGKEIDHLCRNRACVNPAHLEAVSHTENVRRGAVGAVNRARQLAITQCRHGHPYSGDNVKFNGNGSRYCRTCNRDRHRRYRSVA